MLWVGLALEFLVDDLLGFRDCVVFPVKSAERVKDLVVNSFNEHHFVKRVKHSS